MPHLFWVICAPFSWLVCKVYHFYAISQVMNAPGVLGRPREGLTLVVQLYICEQLAKGRSLRLICKDDKVSKSSGLIRYHLLHDTKFLEQYEIARNIGLDVMADELLEIADDGTNDFVTKHNKDGSSYLAVNIEHIQRSRLRSDVRKWYLSKLAPKRYGDRIQTDLTNSDGSLQGISIDEVSAKLQQIIATARARQAKEITGKTITIGFEDTGIDEFY